jgi:hypothetical protein
MVRGCSASCGGGSVVYSVPTGQPHSSTHHHHPRPPRARRTPTSSASTSTARARPPSLRCSTATRAARRPRSARATWWGCWCRRRRTAAATSRAPSPRWAPAPPCPCGLACVWFGLAARLGSSLGRAPPRSCNPCETTFATHRAADLPDAGRQANGPGPPTGAGLPAGRCAGGARALVSLLHRPAQGGYCFLCRTRNAGRRPSPQGLRSKPTLDRRRGHALTRALRPPPPPLPGLQPGPDHAANAALAEGYGTLAEDGSYRGVKARGGGEGADGMRFTCSRWCSRAPACSRQPRGAAGSCLALFACC